MGSAVLAAVVLLLGSAPAPVAVAAAAAPAQGCSSASVSVTDRTLYEGTPAPGDSAYTTFTFTVSVTGCAPTGTVSYKTEDGSPGATGAADYVPVHGQLSWNGEASPRTVSVDVLKDAVPEPNEPFLLRLYDPVGLNLADDLAAGGVLDDDGADGPPVVVSTDGGKICWKVCAVGVHLGTPAKAPVTVHYRTLPVGAGEPAYVPVKDALLTIPAGASGGDAVVKLLTPQGEAKFVLELFSPSAGTLGNARTEVTIKPGG
ncbi:sodium:calcium exchanger [Amycolatopsis sp. NBC_00355]|uniref:Calx-beta domain-containing protein n=1 Tax=Amycolatopsis sp. NBC_00355 TaxID=2975957 RepID=UPI002E2655C4